MMHTRFNMIVEAGLAIALTYILSLIILFQLPQGGAIHPASMAPLIFFAFRWGGRKGILVGVVYGMFHFLLGLKFTIHPMSIILDYLMGYGILGIAGFIRPSACWKIAAGTLLACMGRCALSIISGAVIFAAYAPKGQNPWIYSAIYNISYIVPEMILTVIVAYIFYPRIKNKILEFR